MCQGPPGCLGNLDDRVNLERKVQLDLPVLKDDLVCMDPQDSRDSPEKEDCLDCR